MHLLFFGEFFFGSWLLIAMCSSMEPCPWSLDVSGGVQKEKPSDAGHVPCTGKEESGRVTVGAVRQEDK